MAKNKKTKEKKPSNPLMETISTVIWALGIAIVLRTFLFQPFHIPSGSMLPGLMKGDYIITTKYSLGYGKYAAAPFPFPIKKGRLLERQPERGDVIVFRPEGLNKNFIKRLVGLPGDEIQMLNGRLHINGDEVITQFIEQTEFVQHFEDGSTALKSASLLLEEFENGNRHEIFDSIINNRDVDNTGIYTVPSGHYFFMGDNRDHSGDSRMDPIPGTDKGGAGLVPMENLMGKAEFILLSAEDDFVLFKPWTWANMRGDRFFKGIK